MARYTITIEASGPGDLVAIAKLLEAQARGQGPIAHRQEQGPECPVHHSAKESKHGGLYCPRQLDDGTYCKWQHKNGAGA